MQKLSKFSDEEIVRLVQLGDKEVFSLLIKRYQEKLLRYAEYLLKDQNDAADVIQEAFIKSYINLNGFNLNKKFSSWVYRIVHNEAMNLIKKNKKVLPIIQDVDFDSGINLEEEIIIKELKLDTKKCLSQMDVKYSEPLTLYFLEEKSYEEISDILRIPVGTVGTRINRAKAIMKKICKR